MMDFSKVNMYNLNGYDEDYDDVYTLLHTKLFTREEFKIIYNYTVRHIEHNYADLDEKEKVMAIIKILVDNHGFFYKEADLTLYSWEHRFNVADYNEHMPEDMLRD